MSKAAVWPGDYRAIQAWGIMMGSFEPFIRGEQMKAFKDSAPLDAVYHREDKGWVRLVSVHPKTKDNVKYIMGWMK